MIELFKDGVLMEDDPSSGLTKGDRVVILNHLTGGDGSDGYAVEIIDPESKRGDITLVAAKLVRPA